MVGKSHVHATNVKHTRTNIRKIITWKLWQELAQNRSVSEAKEHLFFKTVVKYFKRRINSKVCLLGNEITASSTWSFFNFSPFGPLKWHAGLGRNINCHVLATGQTFHKEREGRAASYGCKRPIFVHLILHFLADSFPTSCC